MATTQPTSEHIPQWPQADSWHSSARRRRSSLYTRVVLVNAATLLIALLLLLLTPVTVSSSVSPHQIVLLVVTFVVMVAADAVLLKVSFSGLAALVRRMETVDVLQPRERLPVMGGSETRTLISGFNAMLDRLEEDRRASTRRSVAVLEGERQRISRELHDEIGQRMTGILLQLGRIHADAPDDVRAHVERVQGEARQVLDEVGALAWQIRPGVLDDLGLLSALAALTESLGGDGAVRIEAVFPRRIPHLAREPELAAYRIAQEALTNAVRHSGASIITVQVHMTGTGLMLRIADDGCGLPGAGREGPGLRGMRERALLVGGRLGIHGNRPRGLRIELEIPTAQLGG